MSTGLRESLGRWLFERSDRAWSLCSREDAEWDEWVERNREEWREEADAVLHESPVRALVERLARVEALVAEYEGPAEAWSRPMDGHSQLRRIRAALDGEPGRTPR